MAKNDVNLRLPKAAGVPNRCMACGEMFGSATAYNAHRVRVYQPVGVGQPRRFIKRCLSPEEMELRDLHEDRYGLWRTGVGAMPRLEEGTT